MKANGFQKKCLLQSLCVDHNKLGKILREIGILDHLTCLETPVGRSKATVRTLHGTTDWLKFEKEFHQGCILSPCLFNSYAGYIMQSAGLVDSQAGIKIAGRNISNLRYADYNTLMTETKRN